MYGANGMAGWAIDWSCVGEDPRKAIVHHACASRGEAAYAGAYAAVPRETLTATLQPPAGNTR